MTDELLTDQELEAITGYRTASRQLQTLHARGFSRAYRNRQGKVVLERPHYDAVCRGEFGNRAPAATPEEQAEERHEQRAPHWTQRPEHQERIRADKLRRLKQEQEEEALRIAIEAEYQAHAKFKRAALIRHHAAKRKAARLQRTPPWADLEAILEVYQHAKDLTRSTGVMHHVDHIIPLQGELVSGLHVQGNLRAIPWMDNIKKGNRVGETS